MTLYFVLDFSSEELWPDDLFTIREREDPLLCIQLEKIVPRLLRFQKVNLFSWIHMILNLCKLVEGKLGNTNGSPIEGPRGSLGPKIVRKWRRETRVIDDKVVKFSIEASLAFKHCKDEDSLRPKAKKGFRSNILFADLVTRVTFRGHSVVQYNDSIQNHQPLETKAVRWRVEILNPDQKLSYNYVKKRRGKRSDSRMLTGRQCLTRKERMVRQ
ncbi:hypothetical protein I7I51_01290 [Histoplasma capsulatum]|uniref:Uncharacterized protein n=1 Tax=Ajellomyces capsulatus TaxID=5037 RepID=A0A8A1MEA7_AJECA|nr:hypothetical protein I7I51_01290 [Histoplasma capsulatum]